MMPEGMKLGVLPLCRPTFDVEFAASILRSVLDVVDRSGFAVAGKPELLMDNRQVQGALAEIAEHDVDRLLVVQTTFTDAESITDLADHQTAPFAIWAPSEPRTGERLRLNAFCGLNLASHALGLRGKEFNWLHSNPDRTSPDRLRRLLQFGNPAKPAPARAVSSVCTGRAAEIVGNLRNAKIGRVGSRPPGFDTCDYDAKTLKDITGVEVEPVELEELFGAAKSVADDSVSAVKAEARSSLTGLDNVDQISLECSLRLKPALEGICRRRQFDAVAVRCWPEMFTEYGGAVCGPVSMLAEAGIPCACEADVEGALSQLILQQAAGSPVFLADMVDIDADDDTGVVWHCGQAPASMRDPAVEAKATVHSNRGQPLLFEFPLKPGTVTLMRISKAFGKHKMVLIGGEMLRRPLAFSGTAGVVRFERPAAAVKSGIIDNGLEHHLAVAYGEHRAILRSIAAGLGLPVLEL